MDTFLYMDFYAIKPTLFIKKRNSNKTYLGSILSLITVIILIIVLIFIIFCFINDTGLSVLYEKTSKGLVNLDLNLSKNIFFYRLNGKKSQIIDPRIIKTYPYLTISTSEGTKYELLKESNCDINKLISSDLEYKNLLNFDISSYKCITFQNNSDTTLERRTSPFKNTYINLFVAKCQNNSKENNCASEEEINKFIDNNSIFVSLFLESSSIEHHNYSYPLIKKYYQNSMSIPKDFIFSYTFFWRRVEYYTRNSLLLFNYLFHKSSFVLDPTIKDKDIYSKNEIFYVDKTIGRIQFLITVEYEDTYLRKYLTLIDSLTLLMSVFHVTTKICWFLNYVFTKSYLYYTIFEPIIKISSKPFYESLESNINLGNNYFGSPNPSIKKLQLSQNKIDLSNLKLKNNSLNKSIFNNSSFTPIKHFKMKKNDEIKKIIIDVQNNIISNNINFTDNFLFFFSKLFNLNNKKQFYLQRIEKILHNELSIDYLFQEFEKIKIIMNKNVKINNEVDIRFGNTIKSKRFSRNLFI